MKYVALIGDLVASRRQEARAKVQQNLHTKLEELNRRFGGSVLAAPLVQTAGDEIQGLFLAPERVVDAIQEVTDHLFGAPLTQGIAFGVGLGNLSTGPLPEPPEQAVNVALLDGPCFHRAREALEHTRHARMWCAFKGFGEEEDLVLTGLFDLMHAIRAEWTTHQSLVTVSMRDARTQKDLASELEVNPSVISKSLQAARYVEILRGEEAAIALLKRVGREHLRGEQPR